MPAQTYYLDVDHLVLIEERAKENDQIHNESQALRHILNDYMEMTEGEA